MPHVTWVWTTTHCLSLSKGYRQGCVSTVQRTMRPVWLFASWCGPTSLFSNRVPVMLRTALVCSRQWKVLWQPSMMPWCVCSSWPSRRQQARTLPLREQLWRTSSRKCVRKSTVSPEQPRLTASVCSTTPLPWISTSVNWLRTTSALPAAM